MNLSQHLCTKQTTVQHAALGIVSGVRLIVMEADDDAAL